MIVIFVSTVISSSPLSMNSNPTKFLCISNNKSNSSRGGRGMVRGGGSGVLLAYVLPDIRYNNTQKMSFSIQVKLSLKLTLP